MRVLATPSSRFQERHRSFMRHISHDVGPRAALLYQEIRRCLQLRSGGGTFNGERWIFKTMQELADRFGFSVRDIQRHLKKLCDLGWLRREKKKASKNWDQTYWYTFGEVDPFTSAKSCPVRERQGGGLKGGSPAGSSSSSRNEQPGTGRHRRGKGFANDEQPCALAPDAEATAPLLEERKAWGLIKPNPTAAAAVRAALNLPC